MCHFPLIHPEACGMKFGNGFKFVKNWQSSRHENAAFKTSIFLSFCTALDVTASPFVRSKSFQRQSIFIFGTPLERLWNLRCPLLLGSLACNTWLILPYLASKYLLSLKLVLAAGFALNIEFVLSSHQSTGRNRRSINKSNRMNKALRGLCNGAEVSVRLQEIQYEMNGFGKHTRS